MAALTADVIVDRVRAVCLAEPFLLTEAEAWDTFDAQPATNIDQVFRVPPTVSQSVIGGFGYAEDRTDTLEIWVARAHNGNPSWTRLALIRDMHSLTAAVVRDAHQVSGDYAVLDDGRGYSIETEDGADYSTLRLTLPVNYDAEL